MPVIVFSKPFIDSQFRIYIFSSVDFFCLVSVKSFFYVSNKSFKRSGLWPDIFVSFSILWYCTLELSHRIFSLASTRSVVLHPLWPTYVQCPIMFPLVLPLTILKLVLIQRSISFQPKLLTKISSLFLCVLIMCGS